MAASFTRKIRGGVEHIDARGTSFTLTFLPDEDVYRFTVGGTQVFDIQPRKLVLRASSLGSAVVEIGTWERGKPKGVWLLTYTDGNDSSGTRTEYIARMLEWSAPWVQSTNFDTAGGSSNPIEVCTVPVGANGRLVVDVNLAGVRVQSLVAHVVNEGPDWTDITEFARLNIKLLGTSHREEAPINALRVYGTGSGNPVVLALLPETGFPFNVQVSWYYDSRASATLPDKVVMLAGAAFATNPPSNPTFTLQRQIFTGSAANEPGVRRSTVLHLAASTAPNLTWALSAGDHDDLGVFNGAAPTVLTANSTGIWIVSVNATITDAAMGDDPSSSFIEATRNLAGSAEVLQRVNHITSDGQVVNLQMCFVAHMAVGDTLNIVTNAPGVVTVDPVASDSIRIVELPY